MTELPTPEEATEILDRLHLHTPNPEDTVALQKLVDHYTELLEESEEAEVIYSAIHKWKATMSVPDRLKLVADLLVHLANTPIST